MNIHRTLAKCACCDERGKARQPDDDDNFGLNRGYADKWKIMTTCCSCGWRSQKWTKIILLPSSYPEQLHNSIVLWWWNRSVQLWGSTFSRMWRAAGSIFPDVSNAYYTPNTPLPLEMVTFTTCVIEQYCQRTLGLCGSRNHRQNWPAISRP